MTTEGHDHAKWICDHGLVLGECRCKRLKLVLAAPCPTKEQVLEFVKGDLSHPMFVKAAKTHSWPLIFDQAVQ